MKGAPVSAFGGGRTTVQLANQRMRASHLLQVGRPSYAVEEGGHRLGEGPSHWACSPECGQEHLNVGAEHQIGEEVCRFEGRSRQNLGRTWEAGEQAAAQDGWSPCAGTGEVQEVADPLETCKGESDCFASPTHKCAQGAHSYHNAQT